MAKRTNKTDHVLNLLSGNEEKKDASNKQDAAVHPPTDPENTVSVIDPVNEEAKLADEIRKSLESELAEETEEELPEEQGAPVEIEPKKEQEEFVFLNVMEVLVEEKVIHYMEQFGVCTCSRCKADVMALALTKLPAKYVVVNRAAVSPLINFYSSKYAGQVTVEITKACIRVNEIPHHNRD
ncbi:late competence development ComFB family protein [Clostridium sp. C105KSO13]|uniref:late competence development ComFB family protein n=1 Tax=Clostridium sp. C105KSO13 TaxID=1776045 RepID=UPI0007406AD2|nr:late competence development ComFB family protein [Clostridium sp. C105KSO13]CUX49527.1 Late competence development protein ComFB [Clostridium sp. C105KSO13]